MRAWTSSPRTASGASNASKYDRDEPRRTLVLGRRLLEDSEAQAWLRSYDTAQCPEEL